jgi:hypothetical protein
MTRKGEWPVALFISLIRCSVCGVRNRRSEGKEGEVLLDRSHHLSEFDRGETASLEFDSTTQGD